MVGKRVSGSGLLDPSQQCPPPENLRCIFGSVQPKDTPEYAEVHTMYTDLNDFNDAQVPGHHPRLPNPNSDDNNNRPPASSFIGVAIHVSGFGTTDLPFFVCDGVAVERADRG